MNPTNPPLHETLEIHELLNLKTITMTKSKMLQGLVFDQELKALLQQDVEESMVAVNILQRLLNKTYPQ